MEIPKHFIGYRCSDYFDSDKLTCGILDQLAQIWIVVSADEVVECSEREFLVIGRPGVDGIEFGYRLGHDGIWAHYPIGNEFIFVASNVNALVEGWFGGNIRL